MQFHEDFDRHLDVKSSDRSFGLVFTGFFAILALWPLVHKLPVRWWALAVSAAMLLVALARPTLLHTANVLWMRLAVLLSKVVNPIITGIMFYLVFAPAAMVMRWMGKDPLRLHYDKQAATYWISRVPPGPPPETMSNQF